MDIKRDITSENDIKLMVDSFYNKVKEDELLGYVFNDFAKVDWDIHLPKMYKFWSSLIFCTQEYKGHPLAAHIPLPINKNHFDRWLSIFNQNIDELFEGEVATQTKLRAKSIAVIFQNKLAFIHGQGEIKVVN